jgi:hypothetical protein
LTVTVPSTLLNFGVKFLTLIVLYSRENVLNNSPPNSFESKSLMGIFFVLFYF